VQGFFQIRRQPRAGFFHLQNAIAGLDQFIHVSQGYGAVDYATMELMSH